jgi:gliding motility-associated-like protein
MKKSLFFLLSFFLGLSSLQAQVFTPVPVTGFNHDVFADVYPNTVTCTDTVLDLTNHIMYTAAFAASAGLSGGVLNSGAIADASNTHQYQLESYASLNTLMITRSNTKSLTLVTPASFTQLSFLCFSTERASTINVSVDFTDGTSTSYVNSYSLSDWFNATSNLVITGFGRCQRVSGAPYGVDGYPTDPRFYNLDINLNCADRRKTVRGITISNISSGTNATFPCAVVLAVSGIGYAQTITPTITGATCNAANGSAALSVSGNTGPYSFSWNTSPVQTGNTATNLAAGTYTATITDANNCITSFAVTIPQQGSLVTASAAANPAVICNGASTQLSVTSSGGSLSSYTWTPGNINASTITVSPTTTTTYDVSGLDQYGCSYSKQVTVTVNDTVVAPIVNAPAVCAGQQASLTIQNPTPGATYQWYTAQAGGVVSTGASYQTNVLSGTTTFYVDAISSAGCSNTVRTPITVTVNPSPAAPAVPGAQICSGTNATLTVTNPQAGATYNWYTVAAGGTSVFSGNSFTTPILTANTTYYVEATNASGCVSGNRTSVAVTILPALAKPVVTVLTISASSVTFGWNPIPNAVGYEVSLDGGVTFQPPSSGAAGTTHTVSGLRTGVTVTLQARALGAIPCQNSALSDAVSAIIPDKKLFVPNVFTPNGDGKNDVLLVYGTSIKSMDFKVFNQWGQLIFQSNDPAKGWDGSFRGVQQPVGVYVYALKVVMTDNEELVRKGTINLIR